MPLTPTFPQSAVHCIVSCNRSSLHYATSPHPVPTLNHQS
uniref:Uncharacterized protein n=1 Tax=Ciona savignyi TaxID=51511 RepID=H2YE57_CIOSA